MIILDNNKVNQLIRNTALWNDFSYFKTLATRATKQTNTASTGCSSCAARKAARRAIRAAGTVDEAKAYIIRLPAEKKALLKKALNTDHFRLSIADRDGKVSDYIY